MRWTLSNIPQLAGKKVVITGANSGLGLASAKALAARGAHVILACRTMAKANGAVADIRAVTPDASLEPEALDLSDLSSVRTFARELTGRHAHLDVLLNNAGVMATPYTRTSDGFELQFGTNHLGHFALTGLLFDRLAKTPGARVVNVSSVAHRIGKLRFDDPHWQQSYAKWPAYGMSKLSNLLFTYELARRCAVAGIGVRAVAAHPGYSSTNLQIRGGELANAKLTTWASRTFTPWVAQPADRGALPELYAAVAEDVQAGDFIGPDGLYELRGYPKKVRSSARSHDADDMQRLWELSERLTGVHFGLG
ncbi:MAG: short-chain dehydrogenase/reductase [Myxococcaceae bacterium]|nr:short-chain dehydrogenase/reductase [Myxococcaceae bacterium]